MLILTATNITAERARPGKCGKSVLARKNGTSDYDVWVGINSHCLYHGRIVNHVRAAGAAKLLRLIADEMEVSEISHRNFEGELLRLAGITLAKQINDELISLRKKPIKSGMPVLRRQKNNKGTVEL